jgi:hypothetical protein
MDVILLTNRLVRVVGLKGSYIQLLTAPWPTVAYENRSPFRTTLYVFVLFCFRSALASNYASIR